LLPAFTLAGKTTTVIHVGETFTAYLGAVNVSQKLVVRRLTVTAQLQTPSQRWPLPSSLDANLGVDVRPGDGVDAIVAKRLEETGQHILRVEVGYQATEGNQKTLRKFYRFNVSHPLAISEKVVRQGDNVCLVSIGIENVSNHPMVITSANIDCPSTGLVATSVGGKSPTTVDNTSATALFDSCGLLNPKSSFRYLFSVTTTESYNRGIACGDELGQAVFEWTKTMGESGKVASAMIVCPMTNPPGGGENPTKFMMGTGSDFVVHGTGLSVDVAKVAADRAAGKPPAKDAAIDEWLPVTVEPLEPPSTMTLATPQEVQFLVVNHSVKTMDLQLQFRLNHMSGVAVCGKSWKNLGEVSPNGGSVVVGMRLMPLVGGLLRVQGCCVVDLNTTKEVPQPPLFNVFVDPTIVAEQ
jgi:hypothetical protein